MKIAVMGAGAMGGYLGARLATGGADVSFVARGPHLAAIREHGLTVTSPAGDMLIKPATASQDPAGPIAAGSWLAVAPAPAPGLTFD